MPLSPKMQRAGWLYWRIYETRFRKSDFADRCGEPFDRAYGAYVRALSALGLLCDDGDWVTLTDRGAYWLHALQDLFSVSYVAQLWPVSQQEPWPERVVMGG